jgi:hypothetical protein
MPEAKSGNGSSSTSPKEQAENQNERKSPSNVNRGIKVALLTAGLSTAVAAAVRAFGSSGDPDAENGQSSEGERSSRVRGAMEKASKRGEPALTAGWRAAEETLEPLARTGARRAGRYVGERSPDFVRETLVPPFIKGFNEARNERGSGESKAA